MAFIQNLHGIKFNYLPTTFIFPSLKLFSIRTSSQIFKPSFLSSHQLIHRPLTCKASRKEDTPFTVDYLVHSCGLSTEAAVLTSQKMRLQSPERPDTVLSLLKNRGFSKAQISSLIRKRPFLLLAHPENTLLPKLEFFSSIGVSNHDLARTLSSDPTLLTRSLEKQIIPSYNFLKGILLSNEKVVASLKRTTWIFLEDPTKNLIPNIELLAESGVPQSCISLLLTHFPEAVMQKTEEFSKIVDEVKGMGFEAKKSTFVLAIHALSGKGNQSIWNKCYEVYKRWGWSKDDIFVAFKKHPHCMMLSEKKITMAMDFFVNNMGLASKVVAQCPVVLFFSLDNRIIPRCRVVKVLCSKGLVKENFSLSTVLLPVEKSFLEKFVTKFEEQVPQLLGVYEGKVDPAILIGNVNW